MLDALRTWLHERRLARGWSVAEMGRQLHRAAKATGDNTVPSTAILASYVRRWEAGKIGITERYKLHYCAALGLSPTQFGPQRLPDPKTIVASVDPVAGSADEARLRTAASESVCADSSGWSELRGGYGEAEQGYSLAEPRQRIPSADSAGALMAMIADESLDFGEWADTSNIEDASLEHYSSRVRQLADAYQHGTPFPLLLETKRLRDRVFAKLQGHQRPGQTRELYLVAAQICGLLAWMSGDMSFYRAADTHAWTGWVCAEHADHDGARTWIRATQSKLAFWGGRFIESAQLAENGLRYHCPDSGQVMVTLFHARALARTGRGDDAAYALGQARDALERAGDDEVGGLWSVIPARFHSLASNVQMWRQDPRQVLTETSLALEQFQAAVPRQHNYGAEIHARIDRAQAHLLLGELDGAAAALRPVLALAPENRYEPITQHLAQLRQHLAGQSFHNAGLAAQMQEEIETYDRESIVRELTP